MIAWRRIAADVRIRWTIVIGFAVLALALPPLTGLVEITNPDATTNFTIFLGTEALGLALWAEPEKKKV